MKRSTTSWASALAAGALALSGAAALAGPATAKPDPAQQSRKFRQAVTPAAIGAHLDALQGIADANDGTRASGTPGYAASRDYVVRRLRAAGYRPTVQTFAFPFFTENAEAQLSQLTPDATTYDADDVATMTFSGTGDVSGTVVPVDTTFTATDGSTSGCEASDFAGFPAGSIALMQRGTCPFGQKAQNALDAGATAVLIFNRGTAGNTDAVAGTLGSVISEDLPVLGLSFETGVDLGSPSGTTARVVTDTTNKTRNTFNVIADTPQGNPDNLVMAGAHLDSVAEGPGINDNGSGSATILAVAEQLAKEKKLTNKVRFAWWGAEELGLLGSEHYVADLAENNPAGLEEIAMYLNFDMVGSPNYVRFVYDGDNSLGTGVTGPAGSAQIEQLFTQYFTGQGLASEPTEFNGRSDYGAFLDAGIPAGGLFTGAEGLKTAAQAATYGGEAGVAYDHCYHQACDDRSNINLTAIDEMSDAVAHAVYVLSQSTAAVNGVGKASGAKVSAARLRAAERQGHLALR